MTLNNNPPDKAKSDSDADKPSTSLESDMAALAAVLTQCQDAPVEGQESDDSQVAELLKKLTAADDVAKGVEERLDGMIENLDLLLTALEKEPVDGSTSAAGDVNPTEERKSSR